MSPSSIEPLGPILQKKHIDSNGCSVTLSTYVPVCPCNDVHASKKLVWILHPDHGEARLHRGRRVLVGSLNRNWEHYGLKESNGYISIACLNLI
jgi:hypothetical protein